MYEALPLRVLNILSDRQIMLTQNQVIQGDCRQVLLTFPASSGDLVATDPPGYRAGSIQVC
jgi:predicted methyltransferase